MSLGYHSERIHYRTGDQKGRYTHQSIHQGERDALGNLRLEKMHLIEPSAIHMKKTHLLEEVILPLV